jgi:hypothetical protein
MAEIIVENASQVAIGMEVYDANGAKIGTVQQCDLTNGWFQTEKGIFFPQDRYIPFNVIDRIGPSGIYLTVTKDYIKDMYNQPPTVDVDVVAGSGGARAIGTVPSGYNGSRMVVDSTTISQAIARLDNGLKVYDVNGDKVGRVYEYVPGSDWIVVEKGVFSPTDLYVPVTAIDYLDKDGVYLRVSKDVLTSAFILKPANVDFDVVAAPVGTVEVDAVTPSGNVVEVDAVATDVDGDRLIVDGTTMSLAIERLGKGPKVYDADGKEVGRVYQYDPTTGWLVIEKGVFAPKDLFVPVTAVDYLDSKGVHLRVSKDVLTQAFVVQPANITFVATEI